MTPHRLEAFTDGVVAIIITIMVLELRPPVEAGFSNLTTVAPNLAAYAISFVLVGIYWNNHHHLFRVVDRIDGGVMWSNMALLFCLSLVPFATSWAGEHPGRVAPVVVYIAVQLACGVAYFILTRTLLNVHGTQSRLANALGRDIKGLASLGVYLAALLISFAEPWAGLLAIPVVAVIWLVPDLRIVRTLATNGTDAVEAGGTSEGASAAH